MTMRMYADNVCLVLEPMPTETPSGLAIIQSQASKGHRTARVLASGPGYLTRMGALVPNETKPGDRVVIDALAGQNYALDLNIPRHNKGAEFEELAGDRGEFRIVREEEILAILPPE